MRHQSQPADDGRRPVQLQLQCRAPWQRMASRLTATAFN